MAVPIWRSDICGDADDVKPFFRLWWWWGLEEEAQNVTSVTLALLLCHYHDHDPPTHTLHLHPPNTCFSISSILLKYDNYSIFGCSDSLMQNLTLPVITCFGEMNCQSLAFWNPISASWPHSSMMIAFFPKDLLSYTHNWILRGRSARTFAMLLPQRWILHQLFTESKKHKANRISHLYTGWGWLN